MIRVISYIIGAVFMVSPLLALAQSADTRGKTPIVTLPLVGEAKRPNGSVAALPFKSPHGVKDVDVYRLEAVGDTLLIDNGPLSDSLKGVMAGRGARWVGQLTTTQGSSVSGMYLDPLSELARIANKDADVKVYLERRLSEPDISLDDKIYTLSLAVSLFAEPDMLDRALPLFGDPSRATKANRLLIAESYLKRLEGLGAPAYQKSIDSHRIMIRAYLYRAENAKVMAHLEKMLGIIQLLPFERSKGNRSRAAYNFPYSIAVDVMGSLSDGRKQIDVLNQRLIQLATPTPEEMKGDTSGTTWNKGAILKTIDRYAMIGEKAPSIQFHKWINRGVTPTDSSYSKDPKTTSFADGKIRIIELGYKGCPACDASMPGMNWLQKQISPDGMEVVYVTHTHGSWKYKLVSPSEEANNLYRYYTETPLNIVFPIAVWAGEKVPDEDGGMLPEKSPNDPAFKVTGSPQFFILDGRGVVRRTYLGYGQGREREFLEFLKFLKAEANGIKYKSPKSKDRRGDDTSTLPGEAPVE